MCVDDGECTGEVDVKVGVEPRGMYCEDGSLVLVGVFLNDLDVFSFLG